jgi:hypothetical protein
MARRHAFFRRGETIRETVTDGLACDAFRTSVALDVFAECFVALADGPSFKVVLGERGLPGGRL